MEEFEATSSWNETAPLGGGVGSYAGKFVEFCSAKAVSELCQNNIQEKIADGIFTRFTFDMMLASEMPASDAQHQSFTVSFFSLNLFYQIYMCYVRTYTLVIFFGVDFQECMAKGKEDKKVVAKLTPEQDDVSLFYSDLMPLLVS